MDIKRAKTEIQNSLKAYLRKKEDGSYKIPPVHQRPILLIGPPGIGKTAIMEQVAAECKVGLVAYTITHHTRQSAVGLPFIEKKTYGDKEYSVTKYTMSEIIASVYEKMEETGIREGILFIDEINCVSETLAPTMLQFLQCKTFGNERVPDGWVIVAAGNPPEYNRSVREFDVVTLDRVKRIDIKEDYEVWKEYAYQKRIHNAIISYLDIKKENFYSIQNTIDGRQFVTARGWEDLSELLYAYEELGLAPDQEVAGQYLQHPKIARDFANYLELYHKYKTDYDMDVVLAGEKMESAAERLKKAAFDERYGVISLLIDKITGEFCEVWQEGQAAEKLFEMLKLVKGRLASEKEAGGNAPAALETSTASAEAYANLEASTASAEAYANLEASTASAEVPANLEASTASAEASAILEEVLEELYAEEERRKKLPLRDGEKEAYSRALRLLEEYRNAVRLEGIKEPEAAMELIRERFRAYSKLQEQKAEVVGARLENCFTFLLDTFGEGQELVVFLTELSLNYYSREYLIEYGNETYEKYNKELLYADRRERILREMEGLE